MKIFSALFAVLLFTSTYSWENDFEIASRKAKLENKLMLLNFSGSDWCGPCIRLRKLVFESRVFISYADSNLVLINADFPRLKKNKLSREQQKKNDQIADKYNPKGIFPYTALLDADGKIIRIWEGNPDLSPEQFTSQIKAAVDARK